MEHVFQAKKIKTDEEGIHYIAASLKETALHWYKNQYSVGRIPFTTVEQFARAIKRAFQPSHYQPILRRQLRDLKQRDSVQCYVYEFRNLVGQITGMGDLDQVMFFIEGLKQATRTEVNYRVPQNLEEAIEVAINYDTARFGPAKAYLPNSNTGYGRPSQARYLS